MELKRAVLVMADISGYTRFMKIHTMSLLHAEAIITELLEAVLDHAEFPLTLSKLEGDAAFMYATLDDDTNEEHSAQARVATQDILRQVAAFFEAFHAKARALIACDTCRCEGCNHIADLRLKAFLHVGEVAFKKIRQFEELAGEDVILIHRLLKNTVPAKEYILLTERFYELSGGIGEGPLEARTEEAEGLGTVDVRVYYPTHDSTPLPPRPAPAPPSPDNPELWALGQRFNDYAVNRALGRVEQPRFNNLPNVKLNPANLFSYFVVGIGANIVATLQYQRSQKQAKDPTHG